MNLGVLRTKSNVSRRGAEVAKNTNHEGTKVTKSLSQDGRGLSQICGVFGANWDCPPLRDCIELGAKKPRPIEAISSQLFFVPFVSSWLKSCSLRPPRLCVSLIEIKDGL